MGTTREPIISEGGKTRFVVIALSIWVAHEFQSWLYPIVDRLVKAAL